MSNETMTDAGAERLVHVLMAVARVRPMHPHELDELHEAHVHLFARLRGEAARDSLHDVGHGTPVHRMQLTKLAQAKLDELDDRGYTVNGVAIYNAETNMRGLVDRLGYVGWVTPASNPAAPAPVTGDEVIEGRIRFDFTNADGQPDCKIITHDEMRQRYADLREQKESWAATVAGDAVLTLIDKWMDSYDHLGTGCDDEDEISRREWAADRAAIVAALAQDRASQAGAAGVPECAIAPSHAAQAAIRCAEEMDRFVGLREDYDLDDIAVVSLIEAGKALREKAAMLAAAPTPAADTSTNEAWIARAESKLATQPPAVGVDVSDEMSAAWRECYSATIKALAVVVTAGAPEGADKWDVVDRSAITGQIIRIREAMDKFNKPFQTAALRTGGGAD